ncbi:MAG TPA: PaaI family thioesterase [Acidimicrobiales bacterium]|nr:PaaI family thioesterase [Acidimicrobiales bacterium]
MDAAGDTVERKRRVGERVRSVVDTLLSKESTPAGLDTAAQLLEEAARALDGPDAPAYNAVPGYWTGESRDGAWGNYLDMSMFGGGVNPLGMPMALDYGTDPSGRPYAEGTVELGRPYLGGPDMVHGGYVAGLLDHMFGVALHAGPLVAVTATLTVRFVAPTPIGRPLRLRAWFEDSRGRRVTGRATCHAGDELTAEAEGLFIRVDMTAMAARNAAR